jgi:hypothetical protein
MPRRLPGPPVGLAGPLWPSLGLWRGIGGGISHAHMLHSCLEARQRSSKASTGAMRSLRTSTVKGSGWLAAAGSGALFLRAWTKTAPAVHAHHRAPAAKASFGNVGLSKGCIACPSAPQSRPHAQQKSRPGSMGGFRLLIIFMLRGGEAPPARPAPHRRRCA